MGDCHLPPYSPSPPKCLPGDEKYCKFSYASWCPTCEKNSPRRRSKSETMNNGELPACRRKCKEMKTLSPRKHHGRSSQEYENMDLEYDTKECMWLYEPPKDNNGYYNHRVRSNLMELPTSYISNNYQTSKQMPPLPPPQLPTTGNSNDPSVETRNHGKTQPVDGSGHHSNSPINNKSSSSRLAEDLTLSNNTSPHHNNNNNKLYHHHHHHHRPGAPAGGRKLPVVSSNHVAGNAVAASAIAAAGAESGGVSQFKSENRGAATLPHLSDIVYDTSTFFDKLRSDDNNAVINNTTNNTTTTNHNNTSFSCSSSSIPGNFQDRFTKELESMRERLATWRKSNSQKPDTDRGEGQSLLDFPSLNELLRNGSTNNNNGYAAPKSFDFTKFRDRYFREDPGTAHNVTNKAHIHSKLGKPTSPASSALSPEKVPGHEAHSNSVESTSDTVDCGKIERSPKKQSSISQQILKQLEDDLMKVENCKKLERIEKLEKERQHQPPPPKTNNFNNNNNSLRAESGRSITKRVVLRTRPKSTNLKVKKPTRIVVKPANKSFNETSDEESSDDVTTSDVEDLSAECDSAATSEESTSNTTTTSSDSRTKSPETDDSASLLLQGGSGDNDTAAVWPVIRESLFPNIPPYIRFVPHDADQPAVKKAPLSGGRYLFKWKLSTITPLVVRKTLTNSGFVLVRKSNQWLGTWGKHMKSPMFKTLKDTQKCNHFPGTFQLGRKDRLWRNFQRMINRYGYREFGFIPQTFILPQELKLLKQNWEYKNGDGGETWIIKPPASARGVGIKVINKWSHLPKKQSLVVQKYISNPYLINGSKFDLRLYVLVTSFNPLRIYLYPEGLARFASAKYSDDVKDLKDIYMHLTNYSINKLSSQYSANEDANACQGHKWTLTKLLEYLSDQGVDTDTLWKNLQQLCIKTIISGDSPINSLCEENMPTTYNCYELFGIDVLLDDQLKPWLLEVNISPSLHSASPLDAHVKGPMVHTLFDLAQFHFPPRLAQLAAGGKLPPNAPQCYDARLYSTSLTKKEREKHILFEQYERRSDYLDDILTNLTGDDVRKLCQAEDEFVVKERFQRIFPTAETFRYLNFMRPGYYNRLCDAWETKFEKNRADGVKLLRSLCHEKVHLKVPSQNSLHKNSQNTIPSALITSNHQMSPSKDGHSRPLDEVMQDINIENVPSRN